MEVGDLVQLQCSHERKERLSYYMIRLTIHSDDIGIITLRM
jgi:hypothetical protein